MTEKQFTNRIDGLINDFENDLSTGKELRDGILDTLIELVSKVSPFEPLVIKNLAEVDLFLRETDEFKKDKLIGGTDVYYTKDKKKAIIINFYGDHYRIRYSNKINRYWVRIDENITNKIGDSTMNGAVGMPQVNFYVYVKESCKEDSPYPNHEREVIHEIGVNEILPAMNIYKSLESSIKEVYDDELKTNPVITGYKITKILLALDKYCSVEPNSL